MKKSLRFILLLVSTLILFTTSAMATSQVIENEKEQPDETFLTYEEEIQDILATCTFAQPGENDISQEVAIVIAQNSLKEIGDYESRIDSLTVEAYFLYHEQFFGGTEPVWLVYFFQDGMLCQKMLLSYDGGYIDTVAGDEKLQALSRQEPQYTTDDYERFGVSFLDLDFYNMSLEKKAEFSKKWKPIVDGYVSGVPNYDGEGDLFYQATRIIFGVPGEADMTQEEATELAKQAIIALGASSSTIDRRHIGYSFDITDSGQPLWVLAFYPAYMDDVKETMRDNNSNTYRVFIDSNTRSVIDAYDSNDKKTDGFYY